MSWYQQASLYVEFNSGFLQRYCSLNVFGLTFPTMVHRGGHHETQAGADFANNCCNRGADIGDRRFMEQRWWWPRWRRPWRLSLKAADDLQGSCPTHIGETPTARLD